jgi:hypothetical protein
MNLNRLPGLLSLALIAPLLAGCSAPTSQSLAKEICGSRFTLIDIDPNSEAGAPKWFEIYQKAAEIRNSSTPSEQDLAVAASMEDWFNSAYTAVQQGAEWPIYGEAFAAAGMELNTACQPFN